MSKVKKVIIGFFIWLGSATLLLIAIALLSPTSSDGFTEISLLSLLLLAVLPIMIALCLVKTISQKNLKLNNILKESEDDAEAISEWERWKREKNARVFTTVDTVSTNRSEALNNSITIKGIEPRDRDRFVQAVDAVVEAKQASVSLIQRRLALGYSGAINLINKMEEAGLIGEFDGKNPRKALITKEQWRDMKPYLRFLEDYNGASDSNDVLFAPMSPELERWVNSTKEASDEKGVTVVDGMDGHTFECWCAELLRRNGFTNVSVTPGSGDQGVDVLARKDGIKYAIQCKCYSSDLGNTPIQEVHAGKAFYGCQVGAVMTNRHFTKGARELAEKTGVLLWDREKLMQMLNK